MPGIQGQPAPRPGDVQAPVPGADLAAAAQAFMAKTSANPPAVNLPTPGAPVQPAQGGGAAAPQDISQAAAAFMAQQATQSPADAGGPGTGQAQTALESFGNGAALGYLPQMQAGAESGVNTLGDIKDKALQTIGLPQLASIDAQLKQQGFKLPDASYVEARDADIARQKAQASTNPVTAAAARLAGGAASGIAATPLLPEAAASSGLAAKIMNSALQGAKVGGAYGLAANPGDTAGQVNPLQAGDRVEGAKAGAAMGMAFGVAIPVAGAAAKASQSALLEVGSRIAKVDPEVVNNYWSAPQAVKDLAVSSGGSVPEAAESIRSDAQSSIQATKQKLEAPVTQLLDSRAAADTPAAAGNAVKQQLNQSLGTENSKFIQSYGMLDNVSKAMPIEINSKLKFGAAILKDLDSDASGHIPAYRNAALAFRDQLAGADTGAAVEQSIKSLQDDISSAYASGNTNKAKFLGALKDKTNDWLEAQTNSLAERAMSGRASPEELQALGKMGDAMGMSGLNPKKFASDVAEAYMSTKSAVKADYAPFKDFQSDIGEQTKASGRGVISLLKNINDTPPEQLMDRMLDMKNSEALARMRDNPKTNGVFQTVANYGVQKLKDAAVTDGQFDVQKFVANVMDPRKVPVDVRNVLFTPQELQAMNSTVKNPTYQAFNGLVDATSNMLKPLSSTGTLLRAGRPDSSEAANLGKLSLIVGKNLVPQAQALSAMDTFASGKTSFTQSTLKAGMDFTKNLQGFAQSAAKKMQLQQVSGKFPGAQ